MESQERERPEVLRESHSAGRMPALSARCVMRVLNDPALGTVIVYEPEVRTADGARALVFENDAFYQKVYGYPSDWRKLPDAELLRLVNDAPL